MGEHGRELMLPALPNVVDMLRAWAEQEPFASIRGAISQLEADAARQMVPLRQYAARLQEQLDA